ncbi:MAG: hypothetical protein FWJ83_01595 [Limnochordales bacterium]
MSHKLKAHEFLHIQEHLRSEAVVAHHARSMARQCQDPELRRFVEEQGRLAQENVQRLMGFLQS